MNSRPYASARSASALGMVMVMVMVMLAACGGNEAPESKAGEPIAREFQADQTAADPHGALDRLRLAAQGDSGHGPTGASVQASLANGAQLNQATLAQAEQQALFADASPSVDLSELKVDEIAAKSAYLSGDVARKAAAVRIPAYRFYNTRTGAHFYTVSETERATVATTLSPPFSFDGPAFSVASAHSAGLSSVHRFYNTQTGVHFYTISETERANVAATLPQFTYEGVAYYASQVAGAGLTPLYRFYVASKGFHFYTASATEKANIQATLSATYTYEGIGYYVLDTGWAARERLPHTGITSSQCYQAGSNVLVACSSGGATTLNPQQDGHRTAVASMSYSDVIGSSALGPVIYPKTSCVRDNVTGLIWEGKEASGFRAGSNTYTNLGNNFSADAYKADVNGMELCGFTDWRLPTRNELLTLMDYGKSGLPIQDIWFPNTANAPYWSSNGLSTDNLKAWFTRFSPNLGYSTNAERTITNAVRLVRGGVPGGPRYSYSTVAYLGDASNNVVNDAWTGLQWRRCEQGRVWSGSTCTGTAYSIGHQAALTHAKAQVGWRLPNVKELNSLTDLSVSAEDVARIDGVAFPGATASSVWSSSPLHSYAESAWWVDFRVGYVDFLESRSNGKLMRLVRANP